jgi:hypothetical protein
MPIYVDEAIILWRGKRWAHLLGSDLAELHAFARRLGLSRSWFQGVGHRVPHYDVTTGMRFKALKLGAVPIESGDLPDDVIRWPGGQEPAAAPVQAVAAQRIRAYSGLGSRETPEDILALFERLGKRLAWQGWTLRSGGAPGADQAFERGAWAARQAFERHPALRGDRSEPPVPEIYLPWASFERATRGQLAPARLTCPAKEAYALSAPFHPVWEKLTQGAQSLHARNLHQVLGANLAAPVRSRFLVCWTKNGKGRGGTGQALRMASEYDVEVVDAGAPEGLARIEAFFEPAEDAT